MSFGLCKTLNYELVVDGWAHPSTASVPVTALLCVTIRYDSVCLTCSKKLTGSLPHWTNKKN